LDGIQTIHHEIRRKVLHLSLVWYANCNPTT
jgi:hypothetical protein